MGSYVTIEGNLQTVTMTLPAEQRCHYIRDDELMNLGHMDQDPVKDICLATVGVFFGAVVPAVAGYLHFNGGDTTHPFTGIDLLSMLITVAAFFTIMITGYLWYRRAGQRTSLVEDIQKRPKVAVRLVYDNAEVTTV